MDIEDRDDIDAANQRLAETMRGIQKFTAVSRDTFAAVKLAADEGQSLYAYAEAAQFHDDAQQALEAVDRCRASMARFLDRLECPADQAALIEPDVEPQRETKWERCQREFWQEFAVFLRRWADYADRKQAGR